MYEASRVNCKSWAVQLQRLCGTFLTSVVCIYLQGRVNFTLFNLLTLPSHKSLWLSFTVLSYRLRNSTYRKMRFLKRFSGVTGIRVMLFLERSLKEIVMQFSKAVFPKVIRWILLQEQPTVSKTSLGCTLSSSKFRCLQLIIQSDNASVQFSSLKKQGPYTYSKYLDFTSWQLLRSQILNTRLKKVRLKFVYAVKSL